MEKKLGVRHNIKRNRYDNTIFYHIILENKTSNSITNVDGESICLSDCEIHFIYRHRGVDGGEIISSFFNPSKVDHKKSNGNSDMWNYSEQYFPTSEGFWFIGKSIKVLEKVRAKHNSQEDIVISDQEFKEMVFEEFKTNPKDWEKNVCEVCGGDELYCNNCQKYTWRKKSNGK